VEVAVVALDEFGQFVFRQQIHELGEDSLACVHRDAFPYSAGGKAAPSRLEIEIEKYYKTTVEQY
jgi:hypothetical protein